MPLALRPDRAGLGGQAGTDQRLAQLVPRFEAAADRKGGLAGIDAVPLEG